MPTAPSSETAAMRRAVELAARALGRTSPNPVVGCVILDAAGEIAGEGWHEFAGGPHAEVVALAAAGERAAGGTAVVTLEPCNHTGRTGPCSEALLAAGIVRVVVAVPDPTDEASGGVARLRAAGLDVTVGVLADEAERVNEAWLTAIRRHRPHLTWKVATTLDGRVAAADGTSRWITSEQARGQVHALRAERDAVLVGGGTLAADGPHLAVRDEGGRPAPRETQPLRVVLDSRATLGASARVLDDAAPTLVVVADDADPAAVEALRGVATSRGHEVLVLPRVGRDGGLDLDALLAAMHTKGIRSVLLEGGPTLAAAFVRAGLVDRVIAYIAPALLGEGAAGLAPFGVTTIDRARRLVIDDVARVGPDVRLDAHFLPQPSTTTATTLRHPAEREGEN
ncbi:bifunctional diaminohydroxyphosphoribosylaminopyrimidine deaminase/5-amino-6-(5-phosphoribosylamino)uracil reductase RibD [Janibacter sp. G56]|uniref:bifunctional diaminohydroxyphosphoribosylaminopyrimidine deaminase/5-amino-6-(5-phosphoribosylamino)uracil reductase RibD n=1 Tax=Janibacter sp. G56 TaxID=3418717 RepID=UPI003CFE5F64